MSLIAEYTLQTPLLLDALESTPEMMVQIETLHTDSKGASKVMFWAWGDDFHTFERSMDADSIIIEYSCLTEFNEQRLYRIIPSEEGEEVFTYRIMAEYDIVSLHEIGNYEGLTIRARFPGREALAAYHDFCEEKGLTFQIQNLYPEEQQVAGVEAGRAVHDPHGLTPSQREVLQISFKQGYFAIPRQSTLEEIADELDVSVQAVSTRLRRALQKLLQSTIE